MTKLQKAVRAYGNLGGIGKFTYMKKLGFDFSIYHMLCIHDIDIKFFQFINQNKLKDRFIGDFTVPCE